MSDGVYVLFEDVPLMEFMYLAFTRMSGERCRKRLRSLLLCLYMCCLSSHS